MASAYLSDLIDRGVQDIAGLQSVLQEARQCLSPMFPCSLPPTPHIADVSLKVFATPTVLTTVGTDSVLHAQLEDAIRICHKDVHLDNAGEEPFVKANAQRSSVDILPPPLTLTSRRPHRSPAPSVSSKSTTATTANGTISIDLYSHDQSTPDSRNPRGEARATCTFALADYDPSLPLHLFATFKLRDRDGRVARPVEDEHLTKNFAFAPIGAQRATRVGLGRQWDLALRPKPRSRPRDNMVLRRTRTSLAERTDRSEVDVEEEEEEEEKEEGEEAVKIKESDLVIKRV